MKRKILLLLVIYLAFISLGLPDSLLGSAWPAMFGGLGVPSHYAGIVSMIIATGTVISSLMSSQVIHRFGVAAVTTFSVVLTAVALLGFSYSHHFILLCLLAIPLGLGAGSIDVALNDYVALHYKAIHMNWLHCFWGLGASIGPIIMAHFLAQSNSWEGGYNTIGWIQMSLFLILLISIPLWGHDKKEKDQQATKSQRMTLRIINQTPGLKEAFLIFFFYCTIEASFGLWGASFLVFVRNFEAQEATRWVALYYGGITIGRFLSGIITLKLSNKQLINSGEAIILLGLLLLLIPNKNISYLAFFFVGLGCAPIFPGMIHETPRNFGKKYARPIIGFQMACAYVGIMFMPPLFGKMASYFGYFSLLFFLGVALLLMGYLTQRLNAKVRQIK